MKIIKNIRLQQKNEHYYDVIINFSDGLINILGLQFNSSELRS